MSKFSFFISISQPFWNQVSLPGKQTLFFLIFLLLQKATLQNFLVRTVKITYMEDFCLGAKPITLTFHTLPNIHSLYVKIK